LGESVRSCVEAIIPFFRPMPRENKRRKGVEIFFYFQSCDLYVERSKWCILEGNNYTKDIM